MAKKRDITEFFQSQIAQWLPGISIDCVILGYHEQQLSVLLLEWKGRDQLSLPGGFIPKDTDIDQAAHQILENRTQLKVSSLAQFGTFGASNRATSTHALKALAEFDVTDPNILTWFDQRFVSIGYLALVDQKACEIQEDMFSEAFAWVKLDNLPELIYDHAEMITKAKTFLQSQLHQLPVGLSLLDEKFTMKDLQLLYEAILDKKLDRANFQKRILKLGILDRHEKQKTGAAHKAPYLYSFNQNQYQKALESGLSIFS